MGEYSAQKAFEKEEGRRMKYEIGKQLSDWI